jgi:hypothetical protein
LITRVSLNEKFDPEPDVLSEEAWLDFLAGSQFGWSVYVSADKNNQMHLNDLIDDELTGCFFIHKGVLVTGKPFLG